MAACALAQAVKPTKVANLCLVPSRISLAKLEAQLVGQFDGPYRLKDALTPVRGEFDFVVIDTAAGARPPDR